MEALTSPDPLAVRLSVDLIVSNGMVVRRSVAQQLGSQLLRSIKRFQDVKKAWQVGGEAEVVLLVRDPADIADRTSFV